jgi:hypothetical protein
VVTEVPVVLFAKSTSSTTGTTLFRGEDISIPPRGQRLGCGNLSK